MPATAPPAITTAFVPPPNFRTTAPPVHPNTVTNRPTPHLPRNPTRQRHYQCPLASAAASSQHSPNTLPDPPTHARNPPPTPLAASFLLYNSLTHTKQPFRSSQRDPRAVHFYACGPTVYDAAHVGNFRAFLTYDILKRWLTVVGYSVTHVTNLTDVDDKIIARVQRDAIPLQALTERFAQKFFTDSRVLNILPATIYPRATEHISDMVTVIDELKKRGFAYEKDGSTYFAIDRFKPYGQLVDLERLISNTSLQPTAAVPASAATPAPSADADDYDKNNPRDFVLWKKYKIEDGEVVWDTPLGRGRPGWHIECSCMAMRYLGPSLDIHAGGVDLIFPHHENEIAQAEAYTGGDKPFANYWVHNGFVNIDSQKMSKSLGNFRTIQDIVSHPDDARAFRYLVVSSHYRSTLAFSREALTAAKNTIKRLDALRAKLVNVSQATGAEDEQLIVATQTARADFFDAMNDDLNTPRACAAMFVLVAAAEKVLKADAVGVKAAAAVNKCLTEFDRVLGIFYEPEIPWYKQEADTQNGAKEIPTHLITLLQARANARQAKDWAKADDIRKQIAEAGFTVKDTPQGPQLIPV